MRKRASFSPSLPAFGLAGCLMLAAAGTAAAQEPGAACSDCHEDVVKAFGRNIHDKTAFYGKPAGCESCHRGASEHAQSGEPAEVTNPRKLRPDEAVGVCQRCHRNERSRKFWEVSIHAAQQVGCVQCHQVHGGRKNLLASAEENTLCFGCHLNVRAEVLKRSKHPLRDSSRSSGQGKLSCSACHNPHGSQSRALIDARSVNDKCYQCHFEKKAPVLWEHSPVKQDCLVCHTAHGSSNDKLLTTKVPRLCQECHMQGRHQSGTLAPNSVFAMNRSCLNCHSQVHGSNSPSGAVLQR